MTSAPTNVIDDITETLRTNYVGFAAFTILIWDHIDTFTSEVEYIWKGKKGIVVYLFLLNRYLTPLGFIVNLFAYLSPIWTLERYDFSQRLNMPQLMPIPRCHDFIRYEGSMTVIGIHVVAIMMLLRINALYSDRKVVGGCLLLLFLIMLGMNAWLMTQGQPVIHNEKSGMHACTMIFSPNISSIASSSAWLPLLYDSVVLVLTLIKTIPLVNKRNGTYMMKRLLEDGLIYYTAIFSVTLVLTIMIISAPPGLKNIAAQLELLITVTMMSRITLNLKKCAHKRFQSTILRDPGPIVFQTGSRWPTTNPRIATYPASVTDGHPAPTPPVSYPVISTEVYSNPAW